jgi:hypothetical protein
MPRYAHVNDLKERLHGVNLESLRTTRWGGSTDNLDKLLTADLEGAESWVDSHTERDFTPLAKRLDVISGTGRPRLMLRHFPIVDILQVDVKYDPLSAGTTFGADAIRVDGETGIISLRPSFAVQGPMGGMVNQYKQAFARGDHNVVVQYRSGFVQAGDNVGLTALSSLGVQRIGTITTVGATKVFTCAEPYALCAEGLLLSTRPPLVMLKDGVDDSANWTMLTSRTLSILTSAYSATATYLFAYVPQAIGGAAVEWAAATVLTHKGTKDHPGSAGGAVSASAGPFKEDYGEYQYAGQCKDMQEEAKRLLKPFVRQV